MNEHQSYPLEEECDHQILMHRDVHFSGSFEMMIDYYEKEGKGTNPEFELKRIRLLQNTEDTNQINLSDHLLDEEEKANVEKAKKKYLQLREVYEENAPGIAKLIADLILSEDYEAQEEIDALVKQGTKATKALIELLNSDEFYDPIYPGYGLAPAYAAKCLGMIKDPSSIPTLFEAMKTVDFFTENTIIEALKNIGQSSEDFLLKILKKHPFTKDNLNAAIALLNFLPSEKISESFFQVLKECANSADISFVSYLILGCEDLKNPLLQKEFKEITAKLSSIEAKAEANLISKKWS